MTALNPAGNVQFSQNIETGAGKRCSNERHRGFDRFRNRVGYAASELLLHGVIDIVAAYRKQWGLPLLSNAEESFSSLA